MAESPKPSILQSLSELPLKMSLGNAQKIGYAHPIPPADGTTFQAIPAGYLANSLTRALEKLDAVIDDEQNSRVQSAGILNVKRAIERSVKELRTQIEAAITGIQGGEIKNEEQLAAFCAKVESAVKKFRAKEGPDTHASEKGREVAAAILDIERKVIETLFEFEQPPVRPEAQEVFNKLQKVIGQLKDLIKFQGPLEKALDKFEGEAQLKQALERLKDHDKLAELIRLFPDDQALSKIPDVVKEAANESFQEYRAALNTIAAIETSVQEVETSIGEHLANISRLEAAHQYFEGSIAFNEWTELIPTFKKLKKLTPALAELAPVAKKVAKAIKDWKASMETILRAEEIAAVAQHVVARVPNLAEDDAKVLTMFAAPVAPAKPVVREPIAPTKKENDLKRHPLFGWKEATPEARRAEARRRICANPGLSLINYLIQAKRWNDLRIFIDKIDSKDLQKSGVAAAIAPSAPYKGNRELLKDCFPEAYSPEGEKPLSDIERGPNASRIQWKDKSARDPKVISDVKKTLFEGWPLIQTLIQEERWHELKQLFDRIDLHDLRKICRLSNSCVGTAEGAPYRTKEEMLTIVFPEIYGQSSE